MHHDEIIDEESPLTRKQLVRTCLLEVAIGCVAAPAFVLYQGGWRQFQSPVFTSDFWWEAGALGLVVLTAAILLAIRDYRQGMKKIHAQQQTLLTDSPTDTACK